MRFLLVGPDQEENLSLRYLVSALRCAGHVAELARFNDADDSDAVVNAASGYDWVGLSVCFQSRAAEFFDLAHRIAELRGPRVMMGGHFATCVPLEIMTNHPAIDMIVLHEGEDAIVDVAQGRPIAEIPGVWYRNENGELCETVKRRSREDLESLPFPDRRGPVHIYAGVPTSFMMGSRGCVATCDYCCIVTLHRQVPGKRYRIRNPENVADEMAEQYHGRGIRQFIFHDDNFLVPNLTKNMERIEAFARAWEKRGMKDIGFTIKCRPPDAHPDVFKRLKELGLLRVFFGIESSSELGLKSIGRRQTIEQSEKALEVTRALGISAQYTMMMFHPDATPETIRSDIAFMQKHIDHAWNFCRTEIYAGTPLLARMLQERRARGNYLAYTYRIAHPQVDMACSFALRIFRERSWDRLALMERVIGLDHLSAVAGRFYDEHLVKDIRRDIREWRLECNRDLVMSWPGNGPRVRCCCGRHWRYTKRSMRWFFPGRAWCDRMKGYDCKLDRCNDWLGMQAPCFWQCRWLSRQTALGRVKSWLRRSKPISMPTTMDCPMIVNNSFLVRTPMMRIPMATVCSTAKKITTVME